ncbi:MAG: DUF2207 domain-containing protein [Microgenomates group bacterium]
MKKIFFSLLVIGYLLLGGVFGKIVLAEEIKDFSSKININKDGTVDVEERIIYDFGDLKRHGIFREIPFIKVNRDGKKFILEFKDFNVVDEKGLSYLFTKSKEGEKIKLKIGDPDKTISGTHTYIISYKVLGALTYFSDHDELYWNVTGNEWLVGINSAKAEIYLPSPIEEKDLKTKCYTGSFGSTLTDCQIYISNDSKKIIFETTRPFIAKEGLTIVVGFPKNIVAVLEPKKYISFWETFIGRTVAFLIGLAAFIWYLVLPVYIAYRWFKYGRDPKSVEVGETRAWFDPPKTPSGKRFLTPAEVGVLGDERVDLKDICATLVDLARRGYLRIEEREKGDFWLIKKEKSTGQFLPFEKLLLDKFFKSKKEIRLKEEHLYEEVEEVKDAIYKQVVEEGLFPENPDEIRATMGGLGIFAFLTGNLPLLFSIFLFGRHLPRKTLEGVKAKLVAFSLRNFLKSQERQLTFQADKQMMFEKLLPYAVVFGVEKIWARRFANLDLKPPEWYQGYQGGSFSSINFTNNLNSSLSSFQQAVTSTTSTSGFSSGFSGGSSGGGGGGGGGGSW